MIPCKTPGAFKLTKIIFYAFFFTSFFSLAQNARFKLVWNDSIISKFYIKSYEGKQTKVYISDNKIIEFPEIEIKTADSLKILHSFYEERFYESRLQNGIYSSKNNIELDQIMVEGNKKRRYKFQPKGKRDQIFNSLFSANIIDTDKIDGRFLKSISLRFNKLRWDKKLGSKGKRSDQDSRFNLYLAVTKELDSINLSETEHVKYQLIAEDKGYNDYEIKGFNQDISDFDYLIIAVEPLSPNMILSSRYKDEREGNYSMHLYKFDGSDEYFLRRRRGLDGQFLHWCIDFKLYYTK